MTTIRRECMNDFLKIPYLGLAVDGQIIQRPRAGVGSNLLDLYDLVAEAPGNNIMAYRFAYVARACLSVCLSSPLKEFHSLIEEVYARALESGKPKEKTIVIDDCKCNILYKSTEPLKTLVCSLEEILRYVKEVSAIQVDVSGLGSCNIGKMFVELGYTSELFPAQNICRLTKSTKSTVAVASQASTVAVASQAREDDVASQASTVAVASQALEDDVASQASTVAVASQALEDDVASHASTADDASLEDDVASQASTAADLSLEDLMAEITARDALDSAAPCDPSFLVSREAYHMSMSPHIYFTCNSEFDLEDSGSDG